jgi:hypothetical protein
MQVVQDVSREPAVMAHRPGADRLYRLRATVGSKLSQIEPPAAVVTYSDVGRMGAESEIGDAEFDLAYGSNLEDGLRLASDACRLHSVDRIALIVYSMPDAHSTPQHAFWIQPPRSVEAARDAASAAAVDRLHLDVIFLVPADEAESERQASIEYFTQLTSYSGGQLTVMQA